MNTNDLIYIDPNNIDDLTSVHNNEPKSLEARFQLPADPSAPPVLTVTLTVLFCSAREIYGKFLSLADRILAHALITL